MGNEILHTNEQLRNIGESDEHPQRSMQGNV